MSQLTALIQLLICICSVFSWLVTVFHIVVCHRRVIVIPVRWPSISGVHDLAVSRRNSSSHTGQTCRPLRNIGRRELEMSPVVWLEQGRTARVELSQMGHVLVGSPCHVTALLAHVDLVSALLVSETELTSVDLATVRLERTPLSEGFVTFVAPVRTDTCKHNSTLTNCFLKCSRIVYLQRWLDVLQTWMERLLQSDKGLQTNMYGKTICYSYIYIYAIFFLYFIFCAVM